MTTFRFYGQLNDLLPTERRQVSFDLRLAGRPSVKDAIERLGIPHTEVGCILIDGTPVAFDAQVPPGARVAIYPELRSLARDEPLLRPPLPSPPRFIADGHLGTLARYLRLLGFDTRYENNAPDSDLARESVSGDRVLLTRDRSLLKRSRVIHGCLVRSDQPADQVDEVLERYGLRPFALPFTRCLRCNGMQERVAKTEVLDRLEPLTREHYHEFWRCRDCANVVWAGSHYARMQALVEDWLAG